ncbi:MAG: hypothetical protein Kow00121_52910 [Elainellaceae cyanobacterium]
MSQTTDPVNNLNLGDSQSLPEQASEPIREALESLSQQEEREKYVMRLYVADRTPKSIRAIQQLKKLCDQYLQGRYELEVIDIYQQPERIEEEQIVAVPTLIKELPPPLQRLIGDMTDTEKVIFSLDL